ncbi:MAG: RCC1 domain-containing protein [Bdellovibrionales bacterium]
MKWGFLLYALCFSLDAKAVPRAQTVKQISSGISFTCAVLMTGQVKCWGDNQFGQLGLGNTLVKGARPGEMGANLPALNLGTTESVQFLSTGDEFACAIFQSGKVKCWGRNTTGQLGLGDVENRGDAPTEMGTNLPYVDLGTTSKVTKIALGTAHVCAAFEDGRLKCWGDNADGQLGLGNVQPRGDGANEMGTNLPYIDLGPNEKVKDVWVGTAFSCALLVSGKIKCFGANGAGQLGLGDQLDRGDGANEMGANLPYVDLGSDIQVLSLALGDVHSCALTHQFKVKCWGDANYGQSGYGDTEDRGDEPNEMGDALPAVDLGFAQFVIDLRSFNQTTCALMVNGTMKCWGNNETGALGLGDVNSRGDQTGEMGESLLPLYLGKKLSVSDIATGLDHTCAIVGTKLQNAVKCWGANARGQLGLGDTVLRGDSPDEMGDNLPIVAL